MNATQINTPNEPAKVVDLATGEKNAAAAPPASPPPPAPAEGATGAAEPAKAEPDAKPAVPAPPADPNRLERARAVARAKHQENQRRLALQAEAQRQAQEAQVATHRAQLEAQRAADLQRQLEELRDPMAALAHLERQGLSPKTLAQKAIEADTPEAKLRLEFEARLQQEIDGVRKSHQAELDKFRQADLERQQAQRAHAARQLFFQDAADDTAFPAIAAVVKKSDAWKASILDEATRIAQQAYQRTGQHYTNREILAYLNTKYSELQPPSQTTGAASSKAVSDPKETPQGSGSQETSAAGNSRTLTNKATNVKGNLPPDFDSLSDKEQKALLASIYRQTKRE